MTDKKGPCRCEDQQRVANLIARLTDFFEGLEAETIDKVVAEAKKQATAKTTFKKQKKLSDLYGPYRYSRRR